MENWRRYIPLYMRIFRAFWLYPCFLLVWVLCALCMGSFGEDVYMRIAAACFMPFVYFSVVRVFAEADCEGIARCEAACEGQGLLCRAWAVIRSRGFLIEIAMIGAFTLILPFEAGFFHLADVLFGGSMLPRAIVKLLVLVIAWPLLFLLAVFARLSAWQKQAEGRKRLPRSENTASIPALGRGMRAAHNMAEGYDGVNQPTGSIDPSERKWLRREGFDRKHLLVQLCVLLLAYCAGGVGLFVAVPVFISAVAVLRELGKLRWWLPILLVGGVFAAFWLFHFLRAVRIRRKFIKNLKKLCCEYGFRLEGMKRPYLSLLFYRDGINFKIYANGKVYDCKFFSALRRHWELFFDEHGKVYCRHALRFRRVEFFRFTTEHEFAFESENIKVCIVSPVPKVIFAGNTEWNRPIDTGTAVGDYRIFSSTGLLNALKRDCVEKG